MLTQTFMDKIEKLEGRVFGVEARNDREEIRNLKKPRVWVLMPFADPAVIIVFLHCSALNNYVL